MELSPGEDKKIIPEEIRENSKIRKERSNCLQKYPANETRRINLSIFQVVYVHHETVKTNRVRPYGMHDLFRRNFCEYHAG